ncbi:unnamed protein product [Ixodes pacificus]
MAAAAGVVFLLAFGIVVCQCAASLYDDGPCGPAFTPFRRFGSKHLAQMKEKEKEAVKTCYNISDEDAEERDADFQERRRQCIGLQFPGVKREDLESHLCNISQAVDNNVTMAHSNVRNCITTAFEKVDQNKIIFEAFKRIHLRCVQNEFPEMSMGDALASYVKVVNEIRKLRASVNVLHAKIVHCYRNQMLPEEKEEEWKRLKITCMKQLQPGVPPEELASIFQEDLYNGSTVLDDKLSLCMFMESPTGKWAKEEMEINYQCMREIMSLVDPRHRPSLFYKFGLDVQKELIDLVLACESKGGLPTLQNGIRRPNFFSCKLGMSPERSYDETFDASSVYDNPNPTQKLTLCLAHKRSANFAFIQYREYMKTREKKRQEASDCFIKIIGEMQTV